MFDNLIKMLLGNGQNNNSNNNVSKNFNNQNNQNGNILSNLGLKAKTRTTAKSLYKLVNFEQAKQMIENGEVLLIDVRTKSEFDLMHITTAINIPVSEIEQKIFPYEQTKAIMVYCSSGSRSKNAIIILNKLGYNNIFIWEYGALANYPYKDMLVYGKTPSL